MKMHQVKRIWSRPLFMKWGKHDCPVCGEALDKVETSKIVNSQAEEAKNYDFSQGDGFMVGDVEFVWMEFSCAKCNKNYSFDEIHQSEKQTRLR